MDIDFYIPKSFEGNDIIVLNSKFMMFKTNSNYVRTLHSYTTFFKQSMVQKDALTKRLYEILPQDLLNVRSREIPIWTFPMALTFDRHLGSKFQSDTTIIKSNTTT